MTHNTKDTITEKNAQPIVIVTGLSGSGMSSTLKHLEDFGYEVFDNFPVSMVEPLLESPESLNQPVAIGLDTRTRGFDPVSIRQIVNKKNAMLLFITADETILQKRFTETRRRHPLAADRPAIAGIEKEQELLSGLRAGADIVIDTTDLSIHDLRHMLEGYFKREDDHKLTVTLMSFGFRNGIPREADIVMDVRFLKNPNWEPALKDLTGKYKAVGDYIEQDDGFTPFLTQFKAMLEPLIPRYIAEGKSYLTLAIGCTGGRHRSVYTVETLNAWLDSLGTTTHIKHRDIDK